MMLALPYSPLCPYQLKLEFVGWENFKEFFFVFIIRLPLKFLLVLGLLTWWCASTLGTALLCSSRAGSDLGLELEGELWYHLNVPIRIQSTSAESCLLWSKRSTPKSPRLDISKNYEHKNNGVSLLAFYFLGCLS